jgi:TPR repeat protein
MSLPIRDECCGPGGAASAPPARLARWLGAFALTAGLCLAGPGWSAPALSPQRQSELDRAVIDYASGHLDAARRAFEVLSRQRVAVAEFNLAAMHLRGEVPKPDRVLARRLLERSARGGFVMAQSLLGRSLENGDFGSRELKQAHDWYEMAAQRGDVDAQVAMGTAHYLGRGRAKDPALAAHWYREAAKGGDVGAMYLLASMYEQGDGVERDLRLARYWYNAAAQSGDEAAPGKVIELDGRLRSDPA